MALPARPSPAPDAPAVPVQGLQPGRGASPAGAGLARPWRFHPAGLPVLFGTTLFVSAALLFQVQLMIAKLVLPRLGGAPAVWNTCLVFFQAVLLAGYGYAHMAPAWLGTRRHACLHAGLLVLPLLVLPIGMKGGVPADMAHPSLWLLLLLLATVGLPSFVAATSSPLLQKWYAATGLPGARDPYRLYAASNLGSLVGLVSYPVLVEPYLGLATQGRVWAAGYVLLVLLTWACAVVLWRTPAEPLPVASPNPPAPGDRRQSAPETAGGWRGLGQRSRWLALAFVPSSILLGLTAYLTTDFAAVPLLWVVPLSLYLITFVLAFAGLRPLHPLMVVLLPIVLLILVIVFRFDLPLQLAGHMQLHLGVAFVAMLVCHGELARTRPPATHLTEYYLWLALGGVLGGVFNALLAPSFFDRVVEYPLVLAGACLLLPRLGLDRSNPRRRRVDRVVSGSIGLVGLLAGWVFLGLAGSAEFGDVIYRERNFYGSLRVEATPDGVCRWLFHGMTVHGLQCLDPAHRRVPLGYYYPTGPIGQVLESLGQPAARGDVAVVGLGAGTLACYARPGQHWTFYEINPAVERLARDTRYFTYLSDAEEQHLDLRVILGDGRLELQHAAQPYDLIIFDAFSSDAIPVHLLTREAMQVYLGRLKENGLLAFHLSTRLLRLHPVLANLARDAGLVCRIRQDFQVSHAEEDAGKFSSEWALMARRPAAFGPLVHDPRWRRLPGERALPVWTDDYSGLFPLINWQGKPYLIR